MPMHSLGLSSDSASSWTAQCTGAGAADNHCHGVRLPYCCDMQCWMPCKAYASDHTTDDHASDVHTTADPHDVHTTAAPHGHGRAALNFHESTGTQITG
eukprot:1695088-Amphidinium_carterae.2